MFDLTYFVKKVTEVAVRYPEWRKGQALFNVLHMFYPELAEEIRGTEIDPYYDDRKIKVFWEWLAKK